MSASLVASPDPAVWVRVPGDYPDRRGDGPAAWARAVAADYGPADEAGREVLARLLQDLAESEAGHDGAVYVYLPEDLSRMAKARLLTGPTAGLAELEAPASPLAPAADVIEAAHLGPATRTVSAGRAHPGTDDLLVTVAYRWDLEGGTTVLLTLATLDPGHAVGMIEELDDFADNLWLEADPAGAADPTGES
ncbi:hypothetical protein KZX45_02610 [Georgenia sp. EYE_87]|uniref:hypothetical protein n=1 Tax=Georgenia sp. EYE_87 TaxID=2853448 RepID=UPI0020061BB0|nr:hypothetical protein [Georgenia sp. EYE_87]MCK6209432.1 hypothetical protein [Georgenia sp. EYE_87]